MKPKTQRIELIPGDNIHDVLESAVTTATANGAPVCFFFNDHEFTVSPNETIGDVKARWKAQTGIEPRTRQEMAEDAKQRLDTLHREQADAIANAGVMSESQLRDFDPPWPKSMAALTDFIKTLVDRPHDYGTSVYAMSLAATAAFRFVASQVGASGFQAGCADLDFLKRSRGMKHGFRIIDYDNLLFPQYLDDQHMPGWQALLNGEAREELRKEARTMLNDSPDAHPKVRAHWQKVDSEHRF